MPNLRIFVSPNMEGNVAALDFQYVGGGCGMKDVAFFVDSAFLMMNARAGKTIFWIFILKN
jgi:hypothetical protein